MLNVTIGFPWRPTPQRQAVFDYVQRWWARMPGATIITADTDHDPFNLNACRNEIVRAAENADADVVVICDADVVVSNEPSVQAGIRHAFTRGVMVKPYRLQRYLTAAETDTLTSPGAGQEFPGTGPGDGCLYIVRPDRWWDMGGADERFIGWGGDDRQIVVCAETLIGLRYYDGVAYSLYHADEHRPIGSPAQRRNYRLAKAYERRAGDPTALRAFIIAARNTPWEDR